MILGLDAWIVWAVLVVVVGFGVEFVTITDREPNNTFSVAVLWAGRSQPYVRPFLWAAIVWLVYHGFFEDAAGAATTTDDWAVVVGSGLGTLVRRDPRKGA